MTNQTDLQITQKDATSKVLSRLDEMTSEGLAMPANYNAANALNVAYLKLVDMKVKGQPLLNVVTTKSVYESLLNMVLQGLSPAKNQVYFIAYGNELQMQRSYFGTQAALKRLSGVKDIWAEVIREGEIFEFKNEQGRKRLIEHEQRFETLDNEIIGAYAVIDTEEDGQLLEVMTKKQIDASWSQAKSSSVHNKFGDQMAMRTVINRAAKNYINTSDDSDLLIHAINDTTENEYEEKLSRKDVTGTGPASNQEKSLLEQFQEEKKKEPGTLAAEPADDLEDEETIDVEYVDVDADDFSCLAGDLQAFREAEGRSQQEREKAEINEKLKAEQEPEAGAVTDSQEIDFSKLTMGQIKEKLDEKNVEYDASTKRHELVEIAEAELNGKGMQNELF